MRQQQGRYANFGILIMRPPQLTPLFIDLRFFGTAMLFA
jgi:hypothetical protein